MERSPFLQAYLHVELTRIAKFGERYHQMVHRLRSKVEDLRKYVELLQSRRADIFAKWAASGSHNLGRLLMIRAYGLVAMFLLMLPNLLREPADDSECQRYF